MNRKEFEFAGDKHFYPGMDFSCNVCLHENEIINRDEKLMFVYIKRRKMAIKRDLEDQLGGKEFVTHETRKNKYVYKVKCPISRCNYSGDKLDRHFIQSHPNIFSNNLINLFKSRQVRLFNYYTKLFRSKEVKPLPCLLCYRYFDRLRTHMKSIHSIDSEWEEIVKTSKDIDRKVKNIFLKYKW